MTGPHRRLTRKAPPGSDIVRLPPPLSNYGVSASGELYGYRRGGRYLTGTIGFDGYILFSMTCDDGVTRVTKKRHALVCSAFHGGRPEGAVARHLNGNQTDDRADNLAWGTVQDNIDDRTRHGTTKTKALTEQDVLVIRDSRLRGETLAAIYGLGRSALRKIKQRKSWSWLA